MRMVATTAVHGKSAAIETRFPAHAKIAGVRIDCLHFDAVVERILEHAVSDAPMEYVVTPNAHHIVLLQKDARFRGIYERAFLSVADGVPLLWAAKWLNEPLQGRVNGTDLFERLCADAADRGLRVYLLGGRPGAAEAAALRLHDRHPTLNICGTYAPPMGFERDASESRKIVDQINAVRPHLLFVGLGAPKQEFWMDEWRAHVDARIALGIGVSFEFVGGVVARAPRWMQVTGLEWFYRLVTEPKRMWKRYLIGNVRFCALIVRQRLAMGGPRTRQNA